MAHPTKEVYYILFKADLEAGKIALCGAQERIKALADNEHYEAAAGAKQALDEHLKAISELQCCTP